MYATLRNKLSIGFSLAVVLALVMSTILVFADAATDQSISINGGAASTSSLSVTVGVSVLHCPPGGDMQALEVAFRNDSSESWTIVHVADTPWPGSDADGCTDGVAAGAAFSWDLSAGGSGIRTVYARFKHATNEVFAQDDILYSTGYDWSGFFQPIDNNSMNVAKAGSGIPVKFSLNGDQGLDIFKSGYPRSVQIGCDSSLPLDTIEETVSAGGSSLTYDAAADQYIYVWKTEKSWAGTCRQLQVMLDDGSLHTANFKFK